MKYGLKKNALKSMVNVFSKYPKLDKVLLYGSRAKGNFKDGSDIDLALVGENISIQDMHIIHLDLDELYLPYRFDLVVSEKIRNEDLADHIKRLGIAIYCK